jgi:S1-C subfamily serine protease
VEYVVEQLLKNGSVEVAFLGIEPIQVTEELSSRFDLPVDEGVVVAAVQRGSPAARTGIEAGDVIVELDGDPISTVEDLFAQLRRKRPGARVTVTVVRDGARREQEVTLGGREGR